MGDPQENMKLKTRSTFFKDVYKVVGKIPRGSVMYYGQIALLLGKPQAARQVGWAMRCCPEKLPWHRVVKADGSIAIREFSDVQKELLESEGIHFLPDGRVDMALCCIKTKKEILRSCPF